MNRCHECDAPLPINGTHCPRCKAPRTDIEQQNRQRHRGPVLTFLVGVVGIFFSLAMLLWFAVCAAIGAAIGCAMYFGLGVPATASWTVGILVTLFAYGLSWVMVIWGN